MKRISLLLTVASIACAAPQVYAAQSQSTRGPTHPATQEWVLLQLAQMGSALTATDWTNLCPQGQSIDSTSGCTPNCSGAQSTACTRVLTATELEDETLLQHTAATGLTIFRLTIQPTFTNDSPTYNNASGTNNVRCQAFTLRGHLLNNYNDNELESSGSSDEEMQDYSAGVDLGTNSTNSSSNFLESSPSNGSQRLNQQYYVACMSFTTAAHVATNVNMDGTLSITWS